MGIRKSINNLARKAGYEVVAYDPKKDHASNALKLLSAYGIDLVFDVGAHDGRYGQWLRRHGYTGRMVSFEPVRSVYEALCAASRHDPLWQAEHRAIGDSEQAVTINVAGNQSLSSSILDMLPAHVRIAPDSVYVGKENVGMSTIEAMVGKYCKLGDRLFLKIDVQGYEAHVLKGAEAVFDTVVGIQVELSLIPLYAGEMLFLDVIGLLQEQGYALMNVTPVFRDPETGRLLQVDGMFFRP